MIPDALLVQPPSFKVVNIRWNSNLGLALSNVMGSGASIQEYVETSIKSQFKTAIQKRGISTETHANVPEDTLDLKELLNNIHISTHVLSFDLCSVCVLYALDKNRDGRFSCEEILAFSRELTECKRSEAFADDDFQDQVEGYCTMLLWRSLTATGFDAFSLWFCRLIGETIDAKEDERNVESKGTSRAPTLTKDAIEIIYRLLRVEECAGFDIDHFTNTLVPCDEATVRECIGMKDFALRFAVGLCSAMSQMGFDVTNKDTQARNS